MSQSSHNLRLGLDLGGTKIEAVLIEVLRDHAYRELIRRRIPTQQHLGYDTIISNCCQLTKAILSDFGGSLDPIPIGVGMPGGVRQGDGVVKNSNTTCLNGQAFRNDLSRALGTSIAFDNDANCFALAETRFGATQAYNPGVVFGVIMGTGVGAGIVIDGHVWSGRLGIAGEWGHHTVYASPPGQHSELRPCYCGKTGCVEVYVSGPALEADYARRSGLHQTASQIVSVRGSDKHAEAAIDSWLDAFARGLANVIDVLDPSAVVLGGGLSNIEILYTQGVERISRWVFDDEFSTPVLRPKLGDSAGVIGAALLPRD